MKELNKAVCNSCQNETKTLYSDSQWSMEGLCEDCVKDEFASRFFAYNDSDEDNCEQCGVDAETSPLFEDSSFRIEGMCEECAKEYFFSNFFSQELIICYSCGSNSKETYIGMDNYDFICENCFNDEEEED